MQHTPLHIPLTKSSRVLMTLMLSASLTLAALPASANPGGGDDGGAGAEESDAQPFDQSPGVESVGAEVAELGPDYPTTDDPRVGLAPGLTGAGVASSNMELLDHEDLALGANTNSDLAFFQRDGQSYAVSGNYNGFNLYDVTDPTNVSLRSSLICPGSQNDVSVEGNLLFMSVESTSAKIDCTTGGVTAANRFRGVRIWDISNLDAPVQLAGVQTCKGSHTHTIVSKPGITDRIWIYVSGTASIRAASELSICSTGASTTDFNSSNFSITVIEVMMPSGEAAIVNRNARVFSKCGDNDCAFDPPVVETHPQYGTQRSTVNWLSTSGTQPRYDVEDPRAPGGQSVSQTSACHDITAYPAIGLAAGACQGDGILIDISDPANPRRIDAVQDYNFAYWHSATFNNDGTKVVFTDEWGGGSGARCRPTDPLNWGADAIFDIVQTVDGPRMEWRSYFKLPMVQTNQENCVAHNGSLVPVPGRDIMIQAWYQGGNSVWDFTDSANPVEIAYFDRGPISPTSLVTGGYWSTYWWNGSIFGNEIARGFDSFALTPSESLRQSDLDAAAQIVTSTTNVQHQQRVAWPTTLTTARAWGHSAEFVGDLSPADGAIVTGAIDAAAAADASPSPRRIQDAHDALVAAAALAPGDSAQSTGLRAVLLELAAGYVTSCDGLVITILGTDGADTIVGTSGNDVIAGSDGDDVIDGGGGNDVICGGDGADTITGANGNDRVFGEGGNDRLSGGNAVDMLDGGAGNDLLFGENGDDVLWGGAGNDSLDGGNGDDRLVGGDDADTADGNKGSDACDAEIRKACESNA